MTPLPIILAAIYFSLGTVLTKCSGELFPPIVASMFVKLTRNCKSVIEIFWDEVFIVRKKKKKENLDV